MGRLYANVILVAIGICFGLWAWGKLAEVAKDQVAKRNTPSGLTEIVTGGSYVTIRSKGAYIVAEEWALANGQLCLTDVQVQQYEDGKVIRAVIGSYMQIEINEDYSFGKIHLANSHTIPTEEEFDERAGE